MPAPLKPATLLTTLGRAPPGADGPGHGGFVNPPLVRGSTVLHPDVAELRARAQRAAGGDDDGPVTYGIHGTPTHEAFLEALTALEGGQRSWALPSGLSACTAAILAYVSSGDHILVPDSAYGPTRSFCTGTLARYGVSATFYDPCIGAGIEAQFRPNTRLLFLESPGSLTFEIQDVPRLAELARRRSVVSVIDNTWATPLYFRPLMHGVDVSVHAVTKYIGGHADLLLGTVTANAAAAGPMRAFVRSLGLYASPDDCWLALRGLRSLEARLIRHRATAERLIDWLLGQPEVARVLYPSRPQDPGHELWRRDFCGATGLFGVVLQPQVGAKAFAALLDDTRLFGRGYSWGGFESLMIPCYPERSVAPLAHAGPLMRISAGLEDADDLIADLHDGFARLRAA
jgi:cystathionine beta-lyase